VRMLLPHGIPACPDYPPRAALALATIPTLILSFLFPRQITKGMPMGAIK
jgi:ABC-type glycerol-3-phosphate transport system permease component